MTKILTYYGFYDNIISQTKKGSPFGLRGSSASTLKPDLGNANVGIIVVLRHPMGVFVF